MKSYLVTANTYSDSWGTEITCFGVATNEQGLKIIKDYVVNRGYRPQVTEINTNTIVDEYLGGYYE